MDYINKSHVLTDTESRLLATITTEGVWRPWPSELTYDELRALLNLRHNGYIEHAAYGGCYKLRKHVVTKPAPAIVNLADVDRISDKPGKRVMIVWRDGRKATEYAAGTPEYVALVALGKQHGTPMHWRQSQVISYVMDRKVG